LILHGAEINTIYHEFSDTVLDTAAFDQQHLAGQGGRPERDKYQVVIDILMRHGAKRAEDLINSSQ
jgi:hypothetical protein